MPATKSKSISSTILGLSLSCSLLDRFVCYTEADCCGDSYLKMGLGITIYLIGLCATLRLTAVATPTSGWD
jgi:hypothetical protein